MDHDNPPLRYCQHLTGTLLVSVGHWCCVDTSGFSWQTRRMTEKLILPALAISMIVATLTIAAKQTAAKRKYRRVYSGRHRRIGDTAEYRKLMWSDRIGGYIYCVQNY